MSEARPFRPGAERGPRTLLAAGLALLASCGPGSSAEGAAPAAREVEALVATLEPPPPEGGRRALNEWITGRRELLERLRQGSPEVGREALRTFRERPEAPNEVRLGLLDVAAHAAPREAAPALEALVEAYGEDLGVRAEAAELLGIADPERALEHLGRLAAEPLHDKTYPPNESLLAGALVAAERLEADVGELLAGIATDILQSDTTRHRAVRELARFRGRRVEQALEQVLVESTGNAYLRRLAAQSLLEVLPREEACALFLRVYDREAEDGFLVFLGSTIDRNCR